MRKTKVQKLHRFARILRKELQPSFPVYVRMVDGATKRTGPRSKAKKVCEVRHKGWMGQAMFYQPENGSPYFMIQLNKRYPYQALWETLVHEFAHCMSWATDSLAVDEHEEMWGIAYSRCYRALD